MRERQREREREGGERERETDRQTDRQTQRERFQKYDKKIRWDENVLRNRNRLREGFFYPNKVIGQKKANDKNILNTSTNQK